MLSACDHQRHYTASLVEGTYAPLTVLFRARMAALSAAAQNRSTHEVSPEHFNQDQDWVVRDVSASGFTRLL